VLNPQHCCSEANLCVRSASDICTWGCAFAPQQTTVCNCGTTAALMIASPQSNMRRSLLLAIILTLLAATLTYAAREMLINFPAIAPILFLAAVVCTALWDDLVASIIALLLSTAALNYFWLAVPHIGVSLAVSLLIRTALFLILGGLVCLFAERFRRAEARSKRSETLFADFIRSAPVGFSLHRPDSSFIDINPFLAEINGVPRESHLGKTVDEVIPNIASHVRSMLRKVAETGEAVRSEFEGDPRDPKRQRNWIASYFPVKNSTGEIEAVGTAVLETTKENQALAALQESEAKYKFVTESMSQYVWTSDESGKIDYCNRHFLEFTGLTLEQVRAGETVQFIHPDDLPALTEKFTRSMATGLPFRHEYRVRRAVDGEYRWHLAQSELFTDAAGKKRWLGAGIDITDRKRAEAELQKAHEQMRMLVTSISESFIAIDKEWRFQYANERVLRYLGKSWEEVKDKNMWDLFPPALNSEFKTGYEKVMRERVPHTFEVKYSEPDGAIAYFQVHAYPTPEGLAALVSDITDQKVAESALAENKRLLKLVLDSAEVATWMWNLENGEVLDLGNTAKLFGVERFDKIEAFLSSIHSEDRHSVEMAVEAAKRCGIFSSEFRVRRQQGSISWLRATGSVFRDEQGFPRYLAGVTLDVTERNRAEEARLCLAAIVESTDDAIVSKDLNGILTSWNAAAERLFGYTAEEMIGKSILMIIPPERQDEEPRILANLRTGMKIDHYETERRRKDGSLVQVSLTISPIKNSTGMVVGASTIARDMSEAKRVQEVLVQSEKLAAIGRMAAAIAHEVNNPLEAVMNLAYLVGTDSSLSDSARNYMKVLLDEVARASEITKQTLAFYRDSGAPCEFDVRDVLDSVVRLNRPLLENRRIELVRDYRESELIFGHPSEIRQVFANLFLNALDAVPNGGKIVARISVTKSPTHGSKCIRITVADNGHGISPEARRQLFQPFVTTKSKGNGLGLWVSAGIIKKHGGRIAVRTSTVPGRSGTAFSILLAVGSGQRNHTRPASEAVVRGLYAASM